jgi:hypothetical protein
LPDENLSNAAYCAGGQILGSATLFLQLNGPNRYLDFVRHFSRLAASESGAELNSADEKTLVLNT